MSTTEQHLKRIQEKLQQVLKEYAAVQKENGKLKEDLLIAEKKLVQQQKTADELKQQINVLKVSTGEMNEVDKREFEKRINAYVKEIDKCIAMLSE